MSPKITKPLDIYVRVSATRGRSGDSFISPKDQEARCRALAQARGYTVGKVFTDLDKSGGTMDRPAFNEALQRIRDGVSGGIIVARMDRFSRTLKGAIQTLEEIEEAGGYLIECDGDWDTSTPMGRFGRDLVIRLGQLYREQIADSWKTAKRDAVERGIHITRHVPPGYQRGEGGRLEPHPKHAKTIKQAYKLAAQGAAPTDVAKYLNEQGLPSGDNVNAPWSSSRIKRLLGNRVYLGEARASDKIVKKGAHEPLIDTTTWHRAQRKGKGSLPSSGASYLLSGLVRCASCRRSMRPAAESKHAVAMYRCVREGSGGKCPHPSNITMSRLEDVVYAAWVDYTFDRREHSQPHEDPKAAAALENAEAALAQVEALKNSLPEGAYEAALEVAMADVEEAQQLVATAKPRVDEVFNQWLADGGPEKLRAEVEAVMRGEARVLDGLTPEAMSLMREAMMRDIQTVWVRPPARRSKSLPIEDRVHITWRDDQEEIELPTRGTAFKPLPYTFPDEQDGRQVA